jgi:hypothetical protein
MSNKRKYSSSEVNIFPLILRLQKCTPRVFVHRHWSMKCFHPTVFLCEAKGVIWNIISGKITCLEKANAVQVKSFWSNLLQLTTLRNYLSDHSAYGFLPTFPHVYHIIIEDINSWGLQKWGKVNIYPVFEFVQRFTETLS